jgi:hypothetical protein
MVPRLKVFILVRWSFVRYFSPPPRSCCSWLRRRLHRIWARTIFTLVNSVFLKLWKIFFSPVTFWCTHCQPCFVVYCPYCETVSFTLFCNCYVSQVLCIACIVIFLLYNYLSGDEGSAIVWDCLYCEIFFFTAILLTVIWLQCCRILNELWDCLLYNYSMFECIAYIERLSLSLLQYLGNCDMSRVLSCIAWIVRLSPLQ